MLSTSHEKKKGVLNAAAQDKAEIKLERGRLWANSGL
jgi:hypothetical protein